MTLLITGGAGFIGSALLRHLSVTTTEKLVNVDKLTYAANPGAVKGFVDPSRYVHEKVDVCDRDALAVVFDRHKPDAVFHLAAETHVDRSIDSPAEFVRTNVLGTATLLDVTSEYLTTLPGGKTRDFRFVHVSTDEVYGDLGEGAPAYTETSPYRPSSPYSASKAAADHLVRAWHRTYGLPALVAVSSNNYGPWQFPEKFIPHLILSALTGKPLPIYGSGTQVRDWLHVTDHVRALCAILHGGTPGETYNIAANAELPNVDIARQVCRLLERLSPRAKGAAPYESLLAFVADRMGHDTRYSLDTSRIRSKLGWQPAVSFEAGLEDTVRWYLENRPWWTDVLQRHGLDRRGLARAH